MKGDFSRDSFDRLKHFRRVLMQQGRVQLDADWNEQVSILLHYIQTLAADIIGPYAGPSDHCGFAIVPKTDSADVTIGKGRYYLDGILCENDKDISYLEQLPKPAVLESGKSYVVYLDVWERHITFIEDDDIREKALGGTDTGTRTKTIWQVKAKDLIHPYAYSYCLNGAGLLDKEIVISNACLRAHAKRDLEQLEKCLVEPEARYHGSENQLYRVEVHDGGSMSSSTKPTFKWSRENGSDASPIKGIRSEDTDVVTLELENLGRDDRFGLATDDWVEVEDDASVLRNAARPLLQVKNIDRFEMTVTLNKKTGVTYNLNIGAHALLRRWDQKKGVTEAGVREIKENNSDSDVDWLELENGIKIQFHPGGTYQTGDYWIIPARTALGDVEWPVESSKPKFLPPRGVMHHLAPLAIISVGGGSVTLQYDCRCMFKPLTYDCSYSYYGQLGIGVELLCPE